MNNTYKSSKDNVFSYLSGFGLQKNHVLYKPFKKALQRLFEAGVMEKYPGKNMIDVFSNQIAIHDPQKDLKVLSYTDLKAGFVLWFCAVLIAIFSYFGEIIYFKCTLLIKRIREKIKKNQMKQKKVMKKIKNQRKMRKVEVMKSESLKIVNLSIYANDKRNQ